VRPPERSSGREWSTNLSLQMHHDNVAPDMIKRLAILDRFTSDVMNHQSWLIITLPVGARDPPIGNVRARQVYLLGPNIVSTACMTGTCGSECSSLAVVSHWQLALGIDNRAAALAAMVTV